MVVPKRPNNLPGCEKCLHKCRGYHIIKVGRLFFWLSLFALIYWNFRLETYAVRDGKSGRQEWIVPSHDAKVFSNATLDTVGKELPNTGSRHQQNNHSLIQKDLQTRKTRVSNSSTSWTPTKETPYEVCFVTSVYSASSETADRLPGIRKLQAASPTFRFFAFSNLPDLEDNGWIVIDKNFTQYRRFITQSRWPKFMGWKHPTIQGCQVCVNVESRLLV
jgi:hypothetical protein